MKAAVYIRVSTDQQSTDMQLHDLTLYCKLHGIEFDVFEDIYTGKRLGRPKLDLLMGHLRAGRYKKLIVWKLDRLSRKVRDFLSLFDELKSLGVDLVAFKDCIDPSTPIGMAMMQVMSVLSELEIAHISERTKAGLAAAKSRGVRLGALPREFSRERYEKLKGEGWRSGEIAELMGFSRSQLFARLKVNVV